MFNCTIPSLSAGGVTHKQLSLVIKPPVVSTPPNEHTILSSGLKVGPVITRISPPNKLPIDRLEYTGKEPVKRIHKYHKTINAACYFI